MGYNENVVVVNKSDVTRYPKAPFSPTEKFPEFSSFIYAINIDKTNEVYKQVRDVLVTLGFDKENYNKKNWNPFRNFINTGDIIVIKPNLVKAVHAYGLNPQSIITHASIIRPIIDYILLAVGKNCSITICDVPLQQSNWRLIQEVSGLDRLVAFYKKKGITVKLLDFRYERSYTDNQGIIVKRVYKTRDPKGYAVVNLGKKSALMPIIQYSDRFEITDYGKGTVAPHHNKSKNEYLICKTILSADVFINVPKLKTHRKAGFTCAMKNLVGINGDKRWIAHHRRGSTRTGGDEYRSIHSRKQLILYCIWHLWAFLKRHRSLLPLANRIRQYFSFYVKKVRTNRSNYVFNVKTTNRSTMIDADKIALSEGSWYGNDTIWRCVNDLNKIILFCDKEGNMRDFRQRKYLCVVDSIISGEREGPLEPTPKFTGVILGGINPLTVDYTAAQIMGFDWKKIPLIRNTFSNKYWNIFDFGPKDIRIKYNTKKQHYFSFIPPRGWIGHIEKTSD